MYNLKKRILVYQLQSSWHRHKRQFTPTVFWWAPFRCITYGSYYLNNKYPKPNVNGLQDKTKAALFEAAFVLLVSGIYAIPIFKEVMAIEPITSLSLKKERFSFSSLRPKIYSRGR